MYYILPHKCIGCGECYFGCEVGAIIRNFNCKINQDRCIDCSYCFENCSFDAIVKREDKILTYRYNSLDNVEIYKVSIDALTKEDLVRLREKTQ